jgi:hypothetical protein
LHVPVAPVQTGPSIVAATMSLAQVGHSSTLV